MGVNNFTYKTARVELWKEIFSNRLNGAQKLLAFLLHSHTKWSWYGCRYKIDIILKEEKKRQQQ